MPISKAPYKRGYHQTGRGQQSTVFCSFCGRKVPKHKTIAVFRGFRINDPVLRRELDRNQISTQSHKMHACPSCARHRGIVKKSGVDHTKRNIRRQR